MSKAQKLDAPKLPVQVCAGRVGKIGEAKESGGGHYYVLPVDIAGVQGSPNAKVWFLWRPEFFNPEGLKGFISGLPGKDEAEAGELTRGSAEFVYGKNIMSDDTSLLLALAGSEAKFDELYEKLAPVADSAAGVEGVFKEFFAEDAPVFYFTRQQQREKDENGDMRRKNQYEVGRFFLAGDAKTMKYYEKKAASSDEYEITFDSELPFD